MNNNQDTYKKFIEKQNTFWLVVVGVAMIIFGIYYFFELKSAEEGLKTVSIPWFLGFIYNIGGKFLVSGIIVLLGVVSGFYGIMDILNYIKK